jgi:hypothetical protein
LLVCGRESLLLKINSTAALIGLNFWLYLVKPWSTTPLSLFDIGLLPVLLSFISFGAVATASWYIQREGIN